MADRRPYAVLIASTVNGRDLAGRVAARLGLGLTGDCIDLEINENGELVQLKPALGGERRSSYFVSDSALQGYHAAWTAGYPRSELGFGPIT